MSKKVLVPLAIYKDNPLIPIHGVRPLYIEKLVKYGLLPVFVSPIMSVSMVNQLYAACDGAYFVGGDDIDPHLYGKKKHPKTSVGEPERDVLEITLLKKILKDKKPFLGICRGCQCLAIASGGSLFQHIPEISSKENHNPNTSYDDLLTSKKHAVLLTKESKAYKTIQKEKIMVSSYHHQAVDAPGRDIVIVGKSLAGVVEILEHKDADYFCVGIQGHPEAEKNGALEKVFQKFAKAVKSYENPKTLAK